MKEKTVTGFKPASKAGLKLQNYSWLPDVVRVGSMKLEQSTSTSSFITQLVNHYFWRHRRKKK